MSSFTCVKCFKDIIDTPKGYITGCECYPLKYKVSAWSNVYRDHLRKGHDNGYAAHMADQYCERYSKIKQNTQSDKEPSE